MADTPPAAPKRRRAPAKPAAAKPAAARKAPANAAATDPATPAAETSAAPSAPPAKPKRTPRAKPAAAKTAKSESKPHRAPRRTAAARPAEPRRQPARVTPAPEPTRVGGILAAVGALAALGGVVWAWRVSRVDEPGHRVVESDGAIQIRAYPPLVTAATVQRGIRKDALEKGFRTLADYIFAKSRPGRKIAMTAPVLADGDSSGWRTRFIMPGDIARAALPAAPSDVEIVSEPARRVAAISFPGRADDAVLTEKETALRSWLQARSLPSEGKAVHAFYNAPFVPGPMRRNEVMIVLSEQGGVGA